MMITGEVTENFTKCKYKAYLKFNHQFGNKTEFECLESDILESCKTKFYSDLQTKFDKNQILQDYDFGKKTQVKVTIFVIEPFFRSKEFNIRFDAIEISPHKSSPKKPLYIPIQVSPKEKISKIEKLTLCLKCLIVSQLTEISPEFGKILFGRDLKTTKFSLKPYLKEAKKLLTQLEEIAQSKEVPSLHQNNHCNICEFQQACREKLIEKDDLSLLGRINPKEINKQNNKGIFTIQQLSYTFKPRRQRKRKGKSQRFLWELKALALREKQTYILEIPKLPESKTEIYLDIEGLPEEDFNYLIGLIIRQREIEKRLSFWADSKQDEQKIFRQLFITLSKFNDFTVYHYGNYEIQALKKINKKTGNKYEDEINQIIEKSINLLSSLHYNVYPPIYSNGLKDVAGYLGFQWSDKNASGIQSIVWRKRWELSGDPEYKRKLLQYNIEDCSAMRLVKEWLISIETNLKQGNSGDFTKVEDIKQENAFKFGKTDYQISDFEAISKYAYFDYQREKIYLKTSKSIQKAIKKKDKKLKSANRINQTIKNSFPKKCPDCNHNKFTIHQRHRKLITDLKFFNGGIKRWIVQIERRRFRCIKCKKVISTEEYKRIYRYGRNLINWSINQHITYRISSKQIKEILFESFGIQISRLQVYRFKSKLAKEYKATFEEIKENMIQGPLIQADETGVSIQGVSGYVWVFTSIDSVFYLFKPTREADFLKELLKGFDGVLISDFYTGYDSVACIQQKCLVHLIRNLNDDLFKNQLNAEFKHIATNFGKLLRKIVDTVNKYGLKKRHLNKHKQDVEKFYGQIINKEYESELAIKYQKKFRKYKDKLFAFLNYDGIPWNNNNAETAIKPFAQYRRKADGSFTENSIGEYLILLSIQQTCKYRGISFLEFLKSGEKSIEKYSSRF